MKVEQPSPLSRSCNQHHSAERSSQKDNELVPSTLPERVLLKHLYHTGWTSPGQGAHTIKRLGVMAALTVLTLCAIPAMVQTVEKTPQITGKYLGEDPAEEDALKSFKTAAKNEPFLFSMKTLEKYHA